LTFAGPAAGLIRFVARSLNTDGYSPRSRLAAEAPRSAGLDQFSLEAVWLFMRGLVALSIVAALATPARAHQSSVVYLQIAPQGRELAVTFQIAEADLSPALGLDRDRPAQKSEVTARSAQLTGYLERHFTVENDGFPCEPRDGGLALVDRAGGFFAVSTLRWTCKRTLAEARLRYDLFFDVDPRHQGLARVTAASGARDEHVFRNDDRQLLLSRPVTLLDHVRDYLALGVEHIFTGYDHLAFLFGLLVVAGFDRLRGGLRYVLGVVTAFTAAHSITLICAGLGWVRLSPRLVEPAIALSIAYVAVENLVVPRPRFRWLLTFGFGLIHGFGFASVLRDIGLPPRGLVLSLVSFNVGVELGQLAVVLLVAPALWLFAHWRWQVRQIAALSGLSLAAVALLSRYQLPPVSLCAIAVGGPALILAALPRFGYQRTIRGGGSLVILALSSLWFFERVLGRSWFGGWLG
jgi:hypothetical protein